MKSHLTHSCFTLSKVSSEQTALKTSGLEGRRKGGEQISEELEESVKE